MSATLEDVARAAGVHASTVSRVLSGKTSTRQETRERIFAAIRRLDYHPNSNARSLAGGRTGLLALVLNLNNEDPYGGIFESDSQFYLQKEAMRRHCYLTLVTPEALHDLMKEQRLDGVLLTPEAAKDVKLPENFPYVLLGQPNHPKPCDSWIDNDLSLGAQMAVDHLLKQNYAAISFLGVSCCGAEKHQRQLEGYRLALPPGMPPRIFPTDGTPQSARQVARACLGELERPHAILCSDNLSACGLLQALQDTWLRVPEDVGIVTFHNRPMAEYLSPPLSVIHLDGERLGVEAVRMLMERINCPAMPPERLLIPPRLAVRESSILSKERPPFPDADWNGCG